MIGYKQNFLFIFAAYFVWLQRSSQQHQFCGQLFHWGYCVQFLADGKEKIKNTAGVFGYSVTLAASHVAGYHGHCDLDIQWTLGFSHWSLIIGYPGWMDV